MFLGIGAHLVSQQVGSSDFRFEISASETAGGTVSKYHLQRSSVGCRSGIKMVYFPQDQHMAGVQNSWSKGLYKVGTIGIEKLILHLRYEAGPIGNDAVHKLGASMALAWR